MPTFEYRCYNCSEYMLISDSYDRVKTQEPFKCPSCNKDMIRSFETNFILKGSGWSRDGYVTVGSLKEEDY